ncbi:MAG: exodeoxyribonuclease VII small subunit [Tenericutes bacterium 4572_104]|nr:MAG: exodeoxyribonuclease VII small subunit [Tenericutes bacterium 4572_104]
MKELTFEEKMKELEELIKKLESGDNSLDESVKLYKKGITLAKECHQELEEAEKAILELRTENGLEEFNK